jgi:hypothetical protein
VLAFLQKERGLLKPGYKFQPIMRDDVLTNLDAKKSAHSASEIVPIAATAVVMDSPDKNGKSNSPPANIPD